jgi:hypothetical protein
MAGTDGSTKEFMISAEGYQKGSTTEKTVTAASIGDIKNCILRTTGTDSF